VVYELTETGWGLEPAIRALAKVGLSLLGPPRPTDDLRADRLLGSVPTLFRPDAYPDLAETYQLNVDEEPFRVTVADGTAQIERGTAADPAVTITTDTRTLIQLRRHDASLDDELERGRVSVEGDQEAAERFINAFAVPSSGLGSQTDEE
jgi:hypothetical protein